jgi:replicative DNA helicase
MSREEMYERYMCMASGVSYTRLEHGLLTDKEQAAIAKRMEELSGFGQLHIVQPTYGDRTVRKMCATARTLGADAVYIDQISFVESGRNVPLDLRHREVEYICEDLKAACSDFPIMVAAQFNREAASLGEMADLSKIGLSDAIGQKADLLMGIYASSEMMKSKLFQYGIIAARACEPKTWEIVSELSINTNFRCIGVKE